MAAYKMYNQSHVRKESWERGQLGRFRGEAGLNSKRYFSQAHQTRVVKNPWGTPKSYTSKSIQFESCSKMKSSTSLLECDAKLRIFFKQPQVTALEFKYPTKMFTLII